MPNSYESDHSVNHRAQHVTNCCALTLTNHDEIVRRHRHSPDPDCQSAEFANSPCLKKPLTKQLIARLSFLTERILAPVLNTSIINQFLDQFSRSLEPDIHAVLIWDGAGFHRAGDLHVPSNVTLISLPPYSLEPNPIENLWHHLRSHYWSNRFYADYDDLFDVAEQTWLAHCLNRNLIQSVCAAPFLQVRN